MAYMRNVEGKEIRIFLSGELIRRAETHAGAHVAGRPMLHSSCLILAMSGIKAVQGIGYRETRRLFAERGYTKLPDFRTLHYRTSLLKRRDLSISMEVSQSKRSCNILMMPSKEGKFIRIREASRKEWDRHIQRFGKDFVELVL